MVLGGLLGVRAALQALLGPPHTALLEHQLRTPDTALPRQSQGRPHKAGSRGDCGAWMSGDCRHRCIWRSTRYSTHPVYPPSQYPRTAPPRVPTYRHPTTAPRVPTGHANMVVLRPTKEILGVGNAQVHWCSRGGLTHGLQTPLLGACLTPMLPLPAP